MDHEPDWTMLVRYLSGECTKGEEEEIERWADLREENRRELKRLEKLWELSGQKAVDWDVDGAWKSISGRNVERSAPDGRLAWRKVRESQKLFVRLAATIVLLVGISYVGLQLAHMQKGSVKKVSMREITTDKGHIARFKIDDRTSVTLNAASLLRFPDRFDEKRREVYLEGEAFFEVAPLNGVPFIVTTEGGATVEVLGTEFNVEAWPGERHVQ